MTKIVFGNRKEEDEQGLRFKERNIRKDQDNLNNYVLVSGMYSHNSCIPVTN